MKARRAGFTLIELVVVMGVVAMLLGLGLGMIARIKVADRAALGLVHTALRSARGWAVARAAPAYVRIDPARGTVQAFGFSVVGTWHFESLPITGAFGHTGVSLGGELVDDGFSGRALSFVGEPARSRVEIPVQVDPAYDLSRGFTLRCAVRPAHDGGGDLLALAESAGLDTTDGGGVRAWFAPQIREDDGTLRRGGRVSVATGPGLLRPGRWSEVEVQYDRRRLRVLVDGLPVAETTEDAPVWRMDAPLVLSPSGAPFPGAVDALSISCVTGDEVRDLPKGVAFAAGAPREVVFAPGGGLDRDVHKEPVRLKVAFDDGREELVLVNLYGTVE